MIVDLLFLGWLLGGLVILSLTLNEEDSAHAWWEALFAYLIMVIFWPLFALFGIVVFLINLYWRNKG